MSILAIFILGLSLLQPIRTDLFHAQPCDDNSMTSTVMSLQHHHLSLSHHDHVHLMSVKSVVIATLDKIEKLINGAMNKVQWLNNQLFSGINTAARDVVVFTRKGLDKTFGMFMNNLEQKKHSIEMQNVESQSCDIMMNQFKDLPEQTLADVNTCVEKVTNEAKNVIEQSINDIKECTKLFEDLKKDVENCNNGWWCLFSITSTVVSNSVSMALKVPKIISHVTQGISNEVQRVRTCGHDIAETGMGKIKQEAAKVSECFTKLVTGRR